MTALLLEHQWSLQQFAALGLEACDLCGVVKRRDDRNGPCRGPVEIQLRNEACCTVAHRPDVPCVWRCTACGGSDLCKGGSQCSHAAGGFLVDELLGQPITTIDTRGLL